MRKLAFSFLGCLEPASQSATPFREEIGAEIRKELEDSIGFRPAVHIHFPASTLNGPRALAHHIEWFGTVEIHQGWMTTINEASAGEIVRAVTERVIRRYLAGEADSTNPPAVKTTVFPVSSSRRLGDIVMPGVGLAGILVLAVIVGAGLYFVSTDLGRGKSEGSQKIEVTLALSRVGPDASLPAPEARERLIRALATLIEGALLQAGEAPKIAAEAGRQAGEAFVGSLAEDGGKQATPQPPVWRLAPETRTRLVGVAASVIEKALTQAGEAPKAAAAIARKAAEAFVTSLGGEAGKHVIPMLRSAAGGLTTAPAELQRSVEFGVGSSALSPSALGVIEEVRRFCKRTERIVLLRANTDTSGPAAVNRAIARRRAEAVRDALTREGGVARNRIFVAELAEEDLPVITDQNVMESRNRAVQIEVR
jgi:outer membrane protein OmpA-like peptidoglycan-associated protein